MKEKVMLQRAADLFFRASHYMDPRTGRDLIRQSAGMRPEVADRLRSLERYVREWEELSDRSPEEGGPAEWKIPDMAWFRRDRDALEALVQGADPVTGEVLHRFDPLGKPYCHEVMLYILNLMDRVIETGRYTAPEEPDVPQPEPRSGSAELPLCLLAEKRGQVEITDEPVSVGGFCSKIKALLKDTEQLWTIQVYSWMVRNGLAERLEEDENGKSVYLPTPLGEQAGFLAGKTAKGMTVIKAAPEGQRCILEHLDEIMAEERLSKPSFTLSAEKRSQVEISEVPISLSTFCSRVNALREACVSRLERSQVRGWLKNNGLIVSTGKTGQDEPRIMPTSQGERMGFRLLETTFPNKAPFLSLRADPEGQRYLLDHLEEISKIPKDPK